MRFGRIPLKPPGGGAPPPTHSWRICDRGLVLAGVLGVLGFLGILAKNLREKERELTENADFRIKIVEKPGNTLSSLLTTSSTVYNCKRMNCQNCRKKETKGDWKRTCTRSNDLYKVTCIACKEERQNDELDFVLDLQGVQKLWLLFVRRRRAVTSFFKNFFLFQPNSLARPSPSYARKVNPWKNYHFFVKS